MKIKYLFFLAGFFFLNSTVDAQWSFGIKTTTTRSWFGSGVNPFQKGPSEKAKGMGISVQLYRTLSKHFSIGLEPGLTQRGAIEPFYNSFFGFCGVGIDFNAFPYNNASIYANYAQAPIYVQYKTTLFNNRLEVFGKAGQSASYLVSAYQHSETINRGGDSDISPLDIVDSGFNRWEAGLHAGIGLGWKLGFGVLTIESEYYQGLTNLYHYGIKNRSRSYSLGYRLNL